MHHKPLQKITRDYRKTEGSKARSWLEHRMLRKGEMLPQNGPFLRCLSPGSSVCPVLPAWHMAAELCATCAPLRSGTSTELGITWCSLSFSEQNSS